MAIPVSVTFLGRQLACLLLDPVKPLHQCQTPMRLATFWVPTLRLDCLTELAAGMCLATDVRQTMACHGGVVAVIAIRL